MDTPENNAFLRTAEGSQPDFSEVTGEKCFAGVGKLSLDMETGIWDIEEQIRSDPKAVTFSNVFDNLDSLDSRLNLGWSAAKILHIARQDMLPLKTYLSLHERARKARVHKFQSLSIYNSCKTLMGGTPSPNECQQRVLRKFQLEAQLNGIELSPDKADRFLSTIQRVDQRKTQFRQKVMVSGNRFAYEISDPNVVKDFPSDLLQRMSASGVDPSSGPWRVSLKPDVYEDFLSVCSRRGLRWNTWQAYNMRASRNLDSNVDNSVNIEEIRKFRSDQARLVGYDSFAKMSMETKMAGSVDNVLSMISSLMVKAVPRQAAEMKSLAEFAAGCGFEGDALQAYDVPFYRRLQRENLYSACKDLSQYFPSEHVLGVLLRLSSQLFGLQFEEVVPEPSTVWHPDVRSFVVSETDGTRIATFNLDLYRRPGQKINPSGGSAYFVSQRSRSVLSDQPAAALILNFPQPATDGEQTLLSLSDVTTLFAKFGEALQHLLTTVPHGEVSGLTNIEWDAVTMCQHFMANWVFVPSVLTELTSHHETGDSLPAEAITDVILAANHMAGHTLSKHLYLSHLDISLHTSTDFWRNIMSELWPQYLPYQLDKNDDHPCSFTESLADVWAAAYYSHTWARVMAADCIQAFLEEEENNWSVVGSRFRSTFLSLGGGHVQSEVFRRFRGRDPSPDALTDLYGIKDTQEN